MAIKPKAVIEALRDNEGDVAAAGLTVTDDRKIEFDFAPTYQKTNEYLVCYRSKKRIKKVEGLNKDVHIPEDRAEIDLRRYSLGTDQCAILLFALRAQQMVDDKAGGQLRVIALAIIAFDRDIGDLPLCGPDSLMSLVQSLCRLRDLLA